MDYLDTQKRQRHWWRNVKDFIGKKIEKFYNSQHLEHDANRFFWVFFIAAHMLVLVMLYESFQKFGNEWFGWKLSKDWQETRDLMIDAHRVLLLGYIAVNESARIRFREIRINKPGFYMVGMWVVCFFLIGVLAIMFDRVQLPKSLYIILRDVVGGFAGGHLINTAFSKTSTSSSSGAPK